MSVFFTHIFMLRQINKALSYSLIQTFLKSIKYPPPYKHDNFPDLPKEHSLLNDKNDIYTQFPVS